MTGTDQVVLGDLVYCKENPSGKVTGLVVSEFEDDCGDRYDSSNEDEVSGDIHEERISYGIKVSLFILVHYRGLLLLNQS